MMVPRAASAVIILLSITPVSAMSTTYDPQYCYILDAFLLLYCIIITAFFVRERYIKKKSIVEQDSLYQPINKSGQSTYDILTQRSTEEGRSGGGRKRGDDSTYTPLQKKTDDTYREIEMKAGRRRPDQVYQGLSSMTKDTYDSLNKQPIRPPPR